MPNLPRASHRRLLKRGGHYASTLPNAWTYTVDPLLNRVGRVRRDAVMLQPNERATEELLDYCAAARLRCEVAGQFPREGAAEAIRLSREGRVAGKLVIRVADGSRGRASATTAPGQPASKAKAWMFDSA